MDYIGLLTKIVKESKLTHAEITRRCEDDGVWFNDNYISTIKNRGSIPTDDISRAIARACGRHVDLLVTQACYDKSPKAFKDMFDSIIKIVKPIVLVGLTQQSDEAAMKIERQRLDEMAIAEWLEFDISDMYKQIDDSFSVLIDIGEFEELVNAFGAADEAEKACSHIVPDDFILPTIPGGAKINTKLVALESLKDGDMICRQKDNDDEICIRQIEFLDDSKEKMLLKTLNGKGNKSELVETSDKQIYEKVARIVINLD